MYFHFVFQFQLLEVRAISLFFEFGGGCLHYNFSAKSEDPHSADAGSTKLFFLEANYFFRNEKDLLLCCIVGENDAGEYLPSYLGFAVAVFVRDPIVPLFFSCFMYLQYLIIPRGPFSQITSI